MVARWYGTFTDGDRIRRRVALAWVTAPKGWLWPAIRKIFGGLRKPRQFGGRDVFRSFILSYGVHVKTENELLAGERVILDSKQLGRIGNG